MWKFVFKKVSLFFITFFVVLSAIVLAAFTSILSWEAKPVADWTLEVSRWQKVHDFVNGRTESWSFLKTPWSLIANWIMGVVSNLYVADNNTKEMKPLLAEKYRPAIYVEGNGMIKENLFVWDSLDPNGSKLHVYGTLQLSTVGGNTNLGTSSSCNEAAIGTIRLSLPALGSAWSYCPLQICYPGAQTGTTSGISWKSTCEPVIFSPTNPVPIREEIWIGEATFAD